MTNSELQLQAFQACKEEGLFHLFTDTSCLFLGFFCRREEKSVGITHVIEQERIREGLCEKHRKAQLCEIEKQFASSVYQGPWEKYHESKTRYSLQEETKLLYRGELEERFGTRSYKGVIDPHVQDRWLEVMLNNFGVCGVKRVEEKKKMLHYSDFDLFNTNVTIGGDGGSRSPLGTFSEQILNTLKKSATDLAAKKKDIGEKERQILIIDKYIDCHGFLQTLISNLKTDFNGQKEAAIMPVEDIVSRIEKYKKQVDTLFPEQTLFDKLASPKKHQEAAMMQAEDYEGAKRENFFGAGKNFYGAFSEFIKLLEEHDSKDVHENTKVLARLKQVPASTEKVGIASKVAYYRIFSSYKEAFKKVHEVFCTLFQQKYCK
jgi:hypothetical protein